MSGVLMPVSPSDLVLILRAVLYGKVILPNGLTDAREGRHRSIAAHLGPTTPLAGSDGFDSRPVPFFPSVDRLKGIAR